MRDPVCEIAETLSAVHLRRYAVGIVESRGWQRRSSANVWILEIKRIFDRAELHACFDVTSLGGSGSDWAFPLTASEALDTLPYERPPGLYGRVLSVLPLTAINGAAGP